MYLSQAKINDNIENFILGIKCIKQALNQGHIFITTGTFIFSTISHAFTTAFNQYFKNSTYLYNPALKEYKNQLDDLNKRYKAVMIGTETADSTHGNQLTNELLAEYKQQITANSTLVR